MTKMLHGALSNMLGSPNIVRNWTITAMVAVAASQAMPAQAVTVSYNADHKVTGINDLDVDGAANGPLIDIIFVGDRASYDTAFGNKDVIYTNAAAIRDAIISALNAEPRTPNNYPDIAGTSGTFSSFQVPYRISGSNIVSYSGSHAPGVNRISPYGPNPGSDLFSQSLALGTISSWVVVVPPESVSTTPLPGALPLFVSGLASLGLIAHRRKRSKLPDHGCA